MTEETGVVPFQSITAEKYLPEDPSFVKYSLDVQEIIENLKHDLSGEKEEWSEEEGKWVWKPDPNSERLVNDKGISVITSLLRTHINKDTILSTLEKSEIANICSSLHMTLATLFIMRRQDFEIRREHLSVLEEKIMNLIFMTLKRACGGEEKLFISKTQRSIEKRSYDTGPEKRRGIDKIAGIFSR